MAGPTLPSSSSQKAENHSGLLHTTRPSATTVERMEVIAQVTRHLQSVHLAGLRGGILVQLQPESLGTLQIRVTSLGEEIIARITAETASAQQAIESGREQLRAALEQRGLRLTTLDVNVGQQGPHREGFHFAGQFASPQERPSAATLSSVHFPDEPASEISAAVSASAVEALRTLTRLDFRV
ncbi:MAG: flagellar hook-length control protein FliK [Chloroherpetonaceae bacterium]|nr:flagellar hook-length control protein FliK [Chthonomonadaceae bacterium]MDW8209191.1 flagellar hook-length control protein FliK [Chloroherpetonaceae bacterium]